MAQESKDMQNEYPIPVYRFDVSFGEGSKMAFSEVSGLDISNEPITYRDNMGAKYMPGMEQPVNLTLTRGITNSGDDLYEWINSISYNTINKKDVLISLVDPSGDPVVSWNVKNAFPTKLSAPSLNASSNEVAIESLELMADGLTVEYELGEGSAGEGGGD